MPRCSCSPTKPPTSTAHRCSSTAARRHDGAMQLKGYNTVVTGAAHGLGAAAAKRFIAEGARVVIADINGDAAIAYAKEIDPTGELALGYACDIADPADCDAL